MFVSKTPWIILLVLWMAGATWWHVCKIKQLCTDADPETIRSAQVVQMPSLVIADGDQFKLALPGNFSFAKSDANANMNTLMGSLDSLTAYLKKNPGRTMAITGYYSAAETNSTTFDNLGQARAEGVKQYLIQQGIPAVSLTTHSAERSDLAFTAADDSLYGGLAFAFMGIAKEPAPDTTADLDTTAAPPAPVAVNGPVTEEALAAAEKYTSVFEPIDLYFPLSEANYIKTSETTKFFDEAVKYLAAHKDKKLVLTGHTDNSGPDAVNMQLSRDRANDVKSRLRKSGIEPAQIVVEAKGETAPKASNNTREGRKANRRVTVVVQ